MIWVNGSCLQAHFICWSWSFSFYITQAYGAEKEKAFSPGKTLPQFTLGAPASAEEQEYLALEKREPFSLSQIPCKLIIFEIFSVFCLHCRRQASILNRIYEFVQQDPDLVNDIKMIGIAAKNKRDQVDTWKMYFDVPFPLFPDPRSDIWQKIGKPDTICTLVLTTSGKVLATHLGATQGIEEFFREIRGFHTQL